MKPKKLKFLVIGYGSIGTRHAKNLKNILKNKGEVIICREPGQKIAQGFKTFFNLNKALSENPTAVIIATPPSTHIPIALTCAKKGCHLFIEKPLSNNLNRIKELTKIVKKKNLRVMMGCSLRFHPGLKSIKTALEKQKIGKIISVISQAGQYLPDWRQNKKYQQTYSTKKSLGGGVVLDLIHEIDYLYWFFGKAKTIFAFTDKLSNLNINVEDTADILLKFRGNVHANVHLDYIQKQAKRTCQIIGGKETIIWDYFKYENFDKNNMYIDAMRHFIQCIKKKKNPLIDLEQGVEVLEMALAIKKSSKTGKMIKIC